MLYNKHTCVYLKHYINYLQIVKHSLNPNISFNLKSNCYRIHKVYGLQYTHTIS